MLGLGVAIQFLIVNFLSSKMLHHANLEVGMMLIFQVIHLTRLMYMHIGQ